MSDAKQVLLWRQWGPKITWQDGFLVIEDLNPKTKLKWQLDANELADFGHAVILRAAEAQRQKTRG